MIPTPQVEAECVRILADPSARRNTHDAARLVIHAARTRTLAPADALFVLQQHVGSTLRQDRYGK